MYISTCNPFLILYEIMTIFIVAPDNLKLPTSVFFFCIVMAKASYIFKKDTSIHMHMKERLIPLLQIE